jgi:hypothetical protein
LHGTLWWAVVPALVAALGIAGMIFIGHRSGLPAWPLFAGGVAMGVVAWRLYDADEGAERSLVAAAAAAILSTAALFGVVVPSLTTLFPATTMAEAMRASGCPQPLAASAGFGEASVPFMTGTGARLTDGAGVADFLGGGACRVGFVEAGEQRAFAQRATAIGLRYSQAERFDAINMANGRPLTIAVYRAEAPP